MVRFYCFFQTNTIVASNYPTNRIKDKYGHRFEVLASVKSLDAIDIAIERLKRNYSKFTFEKWIHIKHYHSDEAKAKMSAAKIGKERDRLTRAKISRKMKGESNFANHRHSNTTKLKMALAKAGKPNVVAGTVWVHDGKGNEKRVPIDKIPVGWRKGRDYYSTENGIFAMRNKTIH